MTSGYEKKQKGRDFGPDLLHRLDATASTSVVSAEAKACEP